MKQLLQKCREKIISACKHIKRFCVELRNRIKAFKAKDVKDSRLKKAWRSWLRPTSLCAISLIIVIVTVSIVAGGISGFFFEAVNPHDDSPILLTINSGASMARVASQLKELGLIKSTWGIKLLADFTNRSSKVKAGEYILDKTMSVEEILDLITQPKPMSRTVTITLYEGDTIEDFAAALVDRGVLANDEEFLNIARTGEGLDTQDYYFLQELLDRENVEYMLEGFLFPDTYEFYVETSAMTVIEKMLNRFSDIYKPEYTLRAEELGMTMNEVISLAAIIEKEGRTSDFASISAVLHNRLDADMYLQSDVTVQYVLGVSRLVLTQDELDVDSPYNLYKNKGLTPGPICAPSRSAIEAALYPDEKILDGNYLYFTLTDPATGVIHYSKTLEEHNRVVAEYRDLWAQYDQEHGS